MVRINRLELMDQPVERVMDLTDPHSHRILKLSLEAARGEFSPPRLAILELALDHGIQLRRGRVFADTWDLERFSECPHCLADRARRIHEMNLRQEPLPPVECGCCGKRPV